MMHQNRKPLPPVQLQPRKLAHPHLQQPRIINRGPSVASQNSKRPVAPPVYRPQPQLKAAQAKIAAGAKSQMRLHQPRVIQRMALTVGAVDPIIRRSMQTILVRKEGQLGPHAHLPSLEAGNMALLGQNETLYLDGHGAAPEVAGVPQAALTFGGYTPEQLAAKLVEKGLPLNYAGKIYLQGCNTANDNNGVAYAVRFQKALALRGRLVRVKGNKGFSQVQDTGHTLIVPPTQAGATERATLKQLEQQALTLTNRLQEVGREAVDPLTSDARIVELGTQSKQIKADMVQVGQQMHHQKALTWSAAKPFRPTLAVLNALHYEITPGTYAVIPGDNHNGKSLRTHITRALDRYDAQWNLFASAASTAASPVLRGLLNHPQKLFVAVRWYLTPNQPKPPAEFVQLGTKLNAGSDLYGFLQTEFNAWQA